MLEKTLKLTGGWIDGPSEKTRSHYFYPIFDRVRFCLPVGEKLDGRVECFLFTPFNKKYRLVITHSCLQLHALYAVKAIKSWIDLQVWNSLPQLQFRLLLQPCSWPGQPGLAS